MGGYVKLTLRDKDSAGEVMPIADNQANTGTYSWTIAANVPNGQYRVRVKVKNETTMGDSVVFTIGPQPPASITVTKPTTGDSWQRTKPYTITWTKSGTMPGWVKIDLVDKNSAAIVRPIDDNKPNTGAYLWTIPADVAVGSYRVRVQVKTTTIQDDSKTFNIGFFVVAGQGMTAALTAKTYTVPLSSVWNLIHFQTPWNDGGVPYDQLPLFQARLTCLEQVSNVQELNATAQVGGDHFGVSRQDGSVWYATAASRARVLFDVTPFMGKGADIIEAKLHLTQTHSVRANTSQASCGAGWWFMLTYPVDSSAGWHNPAIDTSCHGDLHWMETDYSVDVTPAVKRWVSGNQFNYGLLLIGTDDLPTSEVHTCYSCFRAELIIKLKVE
jgi:hypothetical protein